MGKETTNRNEKLVLNEKNYRLLFDLSPEAVGIIDRDGRLTDANSRLFEWTGYGRKDIIGKKIFEMPFIPRGERDMYKTILKKRMKGEDIPPYELQLMRKDGGRLAVLVYGSTIRDGKGVVIGDLVFLSNLTQSKASESGMVESEEKYRAIFEHSPVAYYICDMKGNFIDGNTTAESMTGYKREELAGKSLLKIIPRNQIGKALGLLARNAIGKAAGPDAITVMKKDGTLITIELTSLPIKRDGKTVVLGIAKDITESQKTESALSEINERFSLAFRLAPYAITITRASDGRIIEVNDAFFRITGYNRKDISGETTVGLGLWVKKEDRSSVVSDLKRGKSVSGVEYMFRKKNGDVILGLFSADMITINNEKCVLSSISDITESKKAGEALRRSEEKYRQLVESSADGIFTINTKMDIDWANDYAMGLIGYSKSDLPMRFTKIIPAKYLPALLKMFYEGLRGKTVTEPFDLEVRAKNGECIPVSYKGTLLHDEKGKVVGVHGTIRDITARKKTEEEIKESEERYRILYESSLDAIMTLAPPSWRFTSGNPAAVKLFNARDEKELTTKGPWDVSPQYQPDGTLSSDAAKKMIGNAMKEGSSFFEWTHKKLNGEDFPATVLLTRMTIKNQTFLQATVRDNTEQKRSEKALHDSEEGYRKITENTSDMIALISFSANPKYLYISPSHEKEMGFKPSELVGKTSIDFVHPDDKGKLLSVLKIYLKERVRKAMGLGSKKWHENLEYRAKTKSGGYIYMETTADIIGDKVLLVSRNVTERKKTEDKIRESEERYKSLFMQNPDAVFSFDLKGSFISANPECENVSGYKTEELMKISFLPLVVPEQRDYVMRMFQETLKGASKEYETNITHKKGKLVGLSIKTIPIIVNGNIIGVYGIARDITEEKKAYINVEQSERKFKAMFDGASDAIFIHDVKGRLLEVNQMACRRLGYSREEILKMSLSGLNSPKLAPLLGSRIRDVMKIGYSSFETEQMTRDGRGIPTEISSRVIDFLGKPAVMSIARDISERKRMEGMIIEKERRYSSIINMTGQMIYDYDIASGAIMWSGAISSLTGYSAEDMEKVDIKGWEKMIHPDERKNAIELLDKSKKHLSNYRVEYRLLCKDGSYKYMMDDGVFIKDEAGKTARMLGTIRDISERKLWEEALKSSEMKYKSIVENTGDLIMLTQPDGVISYLSPACSIVLGYEPDDIVGKAGWVAVPEDVERIDGIFKDAFKGNSGTHIEYRIQTKEGKTKWVSHSWTPLLKEGKVNMIISIIRDINDEKIARDELSKRNDELERFNRMSVGRELRMIELKKQIKALEDLLKEHGIEIEKEDDG